MGKAAKVQFDSYWPTLFAKALEGRSIGDLICNVGAGGAAPTAVGGGGGGSAAQADEPEAEKEEEKKKEESEEDSDDDMEFVSGDDSTVGVGDKLGRADSDAGGENQKLHVDLMCLR